VPKHQKASLGKTDLKVATPGFQLRKKPIFTSAEGLVSPLLLLYRLYLLLKISSYGWVHMDKQLTLVDAYKQTRSVITLQVLAIEFVL